MSELHIALIAEGPTDTVIIEAALAAIVPEAQTFVLTTLQPERTQPKMGAGWGGVFRWCRQFAGQRGTRLEHDPRYSRFDAFIIHLDADVADKTYGDCGPQVANEAMTLLALPCSKACPPPSASVSELRMRVVNWLGIDESGPKTVICIPSKSSDAWLAAAVFPAGYKVLANLECTPNLDDCLAKLPKGERIAKKVGQYQSHSRTITKHWAVVVGSCSQAARFDEEVKKLPYFAQ